MPMAAWGYLPAMQPARRLCLLKRQRPRGATAQSVLAAQLVVTGQRESQALHRPRGQPPARLAEEGLQLQPALLLVPAWQAASVMPRRRRSCDPR